MDRFRPQLSPAHLARLCVALGVLLLGACSRSQGEGQHEAPSERWGAAAPLGPTARREGGADERTDLAARAIAEPLEPGRFPASVHRPYPGLGATTDRTELSGRPARVACLTCHSFVEPSDENRFASHIEGFHRGVRIVHGGQSCRTCHQVPGFQGYNLADGQPVAYSEVMRLCGQCHARRLLEYERGAHGGMVGFWDEERGPRDRNHCLDCHNAHAPRVPAMQPAPRPRYRAGT
jgi:hypothetical protein